MKKRPSQKKKRSNGRPSFTELDPEVPVGSYKVDSYARVFLLKPKPKAEHDEIPEGLKELGEAEARAFEESAVKFVRREINRLAGIAVSRAEYENERLPRVREDARRFLKTVDNIAARARMISAKDVADLASLSAGFETGPDGSVVPALSQITANLKSLREWNDELKKSTLRKPRPSHSDPLGRHFVELMSALFHYRLRRYPPAGRTGPFVEALAAAWEDLNLTMPPPSKELISWLGQKVERAYRLRRQRISVQKR